MTCLPTVQQMTGKPASVILGEMAIAAGLGGVSLTVSYRDYPAPLLCQLWKYFARSVPPGAVYHVRGQAEVRKIPDRIGDLRLVFVHSPNHHIASSWALEMAMPHDATACPRPTTFSHGATGDLDDDPGAAILIRCDPSERHVIDRWLAAGNRLPANWADVSHVIITVARSPELEVADLQEGPLAGRWPSQFRDREILRGLLIGASLMRWLDHGTDQTDAVPTVTLEDYELVRTLLRSPSVCPVDDRFDALAVAMVKRGNVLAGVKFGDDSSERNPFYTIRDAYLRQSSDAIPPRPLITRKELADLGNKRSQMVRNLIEYLQSTNDYEGFSRMGFAGPIPEQGSWRRRSAEELATLLRSWSVKQVRTHFEQLQKAGLVVAERDRANGPWLYTLPEEISQPTNPFRDIPSSAELQEIVQDEGG